MYSQALASLIGSRHPLGEILQDYWPIFPVAFVFSLLATPLCARLAWRLGILDRPDDTVKTHKSPTAYLGGVGILAGLLAGLLVAFWLLRSGDIRQSVIVSDTDSIYTGTYPNWLLVAAIGFGATVACCVGVLDDILDLSPRQKFTGQALAAAILVSVGIRPNFTQLLGAMGLEIPAWLSMILGTMTVLFFILGATNSLNLLDGLDGLCAGVTAIITVAFAVLAILLATWEHSPVGDPVRLALCLALVGATLGFLPMNRHPARIFMGDAGSMLLGFVAGTLMLLFMETFGRWSVACIIVFGLPILDTAVALARRWLNHRPLFVSDRGHIYDQLMDRGLPLKKTVAVSYLLAGAYAVIGVLVAQIRFRHAVIAFAVVVLVSALAVWRLGFLQMQGARGRLRAKASEKPDDDVYCRDGDRS